MTTRAKPAGSPLGEQSTPSGPTVASNTNGDASTGLNATYGSAGGTSGSSPHITGALALLLSRYPNLDAIQAREVLFTTARNKKSDGVTFLDLWTAPDGQPPEYAVRLTNSGTLLYDGTLSRPQ